MRVLSIIQRPPDRLDEGAKFVTACDLALISRHASVDVLSLFSPTCNEAVRANLAQLSAKLENVRFLGSAGFTQGPAPSSDGTGGVAKFRAAFHSVFTQMPYICSRHHSRNLITLVDSATASGSDYDFVFLDGVSIGYLASMLRQKGLKVLFRAHDVIFETFSRLARESTFPKSLFLKLESRRIKAFEERVFNTATAVICLTSLNLKHISQHNRSCFVVKPFFVAQRNDLSTKHNTNNIGYLGNTTYPPNRSGLIWFLEQVWPKALARNPLLSLTIAGKGSHDFAHHNNVQTLGYIDDTSSFYREVSATIAPLMSGSGIKIKVLDSLLHDVPVIATSVGGEGIDGVPPDCLYISDITDDWIRYLADRSLAKGRPSCEHSIRDEYCIEQQEKEVLTALNFLREIDAVA